MLIDTGPASHEGTILAQLRACLPRQASLSVFLTRAEPDCIGNLGAITDTFPFEHIYTGGARNQLDAFDYATAFVASPGRGQREVIEVERRLPGQGIELGAGRWLEVIAPPIRVLTTFWCYDPVARVLFSSDSFGQGVMAAPDAEPVLAKHHLEPGYARSHLLAKFGWLVGANTDGLRGLLAQLVAEREVETIAPTHGCVTVGRELANRQFELLERSLAEVGSSVGANR
jgi:flavorubredoxin